MSELLKVERLDVHYGGIQAVRDVSFTLREGEQATLIGANGAGKSSTVRAITGLENFSGSIEFNGKTVRKHRPETLGQASRISGVTPAAISLLMVHLKKGGFKGFANQNEEASA